jgi:hypothetical protein
MEVVAGVEGHLREFRAGVTAGDGLRGRKRRALVRRLHERDFPIARSGVLIERHIDVVERVDR